VTDAPGSGEYLKINLITMPLSRFVLLLLLIATLSVHGAENKVCLKKVFNSYCLGGTLQQQLADAPVNMQPMIKGERSGVVYLQDNEKIYVMAYKGVIYKIVRTHEPDTLMTVKDLQRRLQREYGNYQDMSEYPENTQNQSRQVGYIRRGEGELKYVWQLPGRSWRVELGWTRKLGVTISYFVNELDEMQTEAALQGL
jgi:hypothetical protein